MARLLLILVGVGYEYSVNMFGWLSKLQLKTLFEMNEHFVEVLKGSFVGFSVKIFGAIVAFSMQVMLSRQLGASDAGVFFLGLALIMILSSLGRLGLDGALVRFVALKHDEGKWGEIKYLTEKPFLWSFFASVVLAFGLWCMAGYLSVNVFDDVRLKSVIQWLSITIPFIGIFTLYGSAFQGLKKIVQSNIVVSVILPFVVVILLIVWPTFSLDTVVMYYLSGAVTAMFFAIVLWRSQRAIQTTRVPFDLSALIISCKPLWVVQLLILINLWSGQLFLGLWGDTSDVAIFNAAQRIVMLISFVLIAVNSISAAKFSAFYKKGEISNLALLSVQTTRLMLVVSLPLMLMILFFPEYLLGLFGEDFKVGRDVLLVLLLGQFVNVITGTAGNLLVMTGNERQLKNISMMSAIISMVLAVILIPSCGTLGAAIAVFVLMTLSNVLCVFEVKKQLGFLITPFYMAK